MTTSIRKIAALSAAFISAGAGAAEVYHTDSASLTVYGRVKAEALNGYGYQKFSAKPAGRIIRDCRLPPVWA